MIISGPLEVVLVVLIVAYVLIRRIIGEPAQGKRMLLLPGILTGVGLLDIVKVAQSATAIYFLIGSVIFGVVIGLLRGVSIKVFERGGIVFMRYTWVTIVLWAVSLGVKFGANFLLEGFDKSAAASVGSGLMLTLGSGILAEGLVVMYKSLHVDAHVIWAKGTKGAPHQMSPFLDNLQRSANSVPRTNYSSQSGVDQTTGDHVTPNRDRLITMMEDLTAQVANRRSNDDRRNRRR